VFEVRGRSIFSADGHFNVVRFSFKKSRILQMYFRPFFGCNKE